MRTIVDIPKETVAKLDHWAGRERVSRAEIVRRALAKAVAEQDKPIDWSKYFGAWKDRDIDGVAFQRALRDAED
jgi:metal-responsive CopG/Arc/MetJ family transcriptional regulator